MNVNTFMNIIDGMITGISLIGFPANIISISYFIKSEKNGLPNKLMICLNFTDLLTSLLFIAMSIYWLVSYNYIRKLVTGNDVSPLSSIAVKAILNIFSGTSIISGCLTFGLTLLRTIVICNPFYRIKQKLCVSCLVIVVVVLVTLMQTLAFWTTILPPDFRPYKIHLYALIITILSCCISVMSAITIIVLKKTRSDTDGQQQRNHAAVTMVIISAIYFIRNFPGLVMFLIPNHGFDTMIYKIHICVLMISLTSLLNPMVYIFRKRQMQRYIKEQFHKLISWC